jgi:hypothetical protein
MLEPIRIADCPIVDTFEWRRERRKEQNRGKKTPTSPTGIEEDEALTELKEGPRWGRASRFA